MKKLLGKLVVVSGRSLDFGNFTQVGTLVEYTPNNLILSHSSNELRKENRSTVSIADIKELSVVQSRKKRNLDDLVAAM